jgi:hypothetical protein
VSYWTHRTGKGLFSIVERPRGVDAYFGQSLIGHYRSPVQAAEAVGKGEHAGLACAPEDGRSLCVPNVQDWIFVRG